MDYGQEGGKQLRIRTIKPEFFESPDIAKLSFLGRYLYIGMWCVADDRGVGVLDVNLLRAKLFPLDTSTHGGFTECTHGIQVALKQMQNMKMIAIYEVDKRTYYEIKNWKKHQTINRPSQPKYPPSTSENAKPVKIHSDGSLSEHVGLTEDSPQEQGTGNREQGSNSLAQTSASGAVARPTNNPKPTSYTQEFETFWETYPLKRDKRKAFRAFQQARKRASLDEITAGAKRYRDDPNREERYTKYAEGWLRADGWLDAPLPPRAGQASPSQTAIGWIEMGQQLNKNPTNSGRLIA